MAAMRHVIISSGLVASLGLLSGCHTAPVRPIPPAPQLLAAAPLQLPNDCAASGSFVVQFAVHENGATGNIQPPAAPACLQAALTSWVASFRYVPQPDETSMSIEWLMVTGKKGG
jgi:hypothetical protein